MLTGICCGGHQLPKQDWSALPEKKREKTFFLNIVFCLQSERETLERKTFKKEVGTAQIKISPHIKEYISTLQQIVHNLYI